MTHEIVGESDVNALAQQWAVPLEPTYIADPPRIRSVAEITSFRTYAAQKIDWIVDGIIAAGTVTLISGESGSGKSTVTSAICSAVERGVPFAGLATQRQTLAKSWPLPLTFLRGCGLPETFIEYIPSLLSQPIQFYSCFISYSTGDQEFVNRLYADLQVRGVRCWFAPEDVKIGDRFRQRIDEAIRLHDKLLLVLSENSVRSDWVREEVESCVEREHREKRNLLFPVMLDDAVMNTSEAWAASVRRQRHMGNFKEWKKHDAYVKGFERLLRDLRPSVK